MRRVPPAQVRPASAAACRTVRPARGRRRLQRQRDADLLHAPARISRISCWVRVKSVKPSATTRRSPGMGTERVRVPLLACPAVFPATGLQHCWTSRAHRSLSRHPRARRLLQPIAGRPESPLGVVQAGAPAAAADRPGRGPAARRPWRDTPRSARPLEILGPDFQPLQLADQVADQLDQSARGGDGGEVLQLAGRAVLFDELPDQVALHEPADGADRLRAAGQDRLGELLEGHHAGGEAAAERARPSPRPDHAGWLPAVWAGG